MSLTKEACPLGTSFNGENEAESYIVTRDKVTEKYEDLDGLDGTQGSVGVVRNKRHGSNRFPNEWESFCEAIRTLSSRELQ